MCRRGGCHNLTIYIIEKPLFTTDEYPQDLDTTSVGLMITQPDDDVVHSVLDEMLQYMTKDGINMVKFITYIPHGRDSLCSPLTNTPDRSTLTLSAHAPIPSSRSMS